MDFILLFIVTHGERKSIYENKDVLTQDSIYHFSRLDGKHTYRSFVLVTVEFPV